MLVRLATNKDVLKGLPRIDLYPGFEFGEFEGIRGELQKRWDDALVLRLKL